MLKPDGELRCRRAPGKPRVQNSLPAPIWTPNSLAKQQREIRMRGDAPCGAPLTAAPDSWQSLLQSNPDIEVTDSREVEEQDWEDASSHDDEEH